MDGTTFDVWTEWADLARAGAGRVRGLYGPTEKSFLEVGERLRHARSTAQTLTAMTKALAGRLAEPEFQQSLAGLDETLRLVHELRSHRTAHGDHLRDLTTTAQSIHQTLAAMLRLMGHVTYLGVNARIEAAQAVTGNDDFTLFTHEIVRLSARGRKNIEEVGAELASLSASAETAVSLHLRFDATQGEMSERLENSLDEMRRREQDALATLEHLPKFLDETSSRIGCVVAALQFGDISRQRLEHVESALDTLADVSLGVRPLPGEGRHHRQAFVAAMCGVLVAQLADIDEEFGEQARQILDNLRDLAAAIDGIKSRTEAVYGGNQAARCGSETFMASVDRDLEQVASAVVEYSQSMHQAETSLRSVISAALTMAEAMKAIAEVDAEMNLIGLNASLKCGNLGPKGRALNVVAQELRVCARQTRIHAANVGAKLKSVTAMTKQVTDVSSRNGGHELEEIGRYLDGSVECLRQAGGETAWVLSQIREQSEIVADAITQAVANFVAHHRYREQIGQTLAELRKLEHMAKSGLTREEVAAAGTELMQFMEDQYTMSSERLLHQSALSGAAAAQPTEAELADIFF